MDHFEQRVTELINDTSFIRYCRGLDEPEAAVWETRLLTQPELIPVVREAARRIKLIRKGLEEVEVETGLENLRSSIKKLALETEGAKPPVYQVSYRQKWWAAAAVMLLIATGGAGYLQGWFGIKEPAQLAALDINHIIVPDGERKSISLPDGTTVILNGGSDLVLTSGFNATNREVKLRGEAYFNVKPDARKPFVIHTAAMNIRVLGTSFNVRSYPGETTDAASLIQGKIEVTLTSGVEKSSRYILQPMQKLVVKKTAASGKNQATGKTLEESAPVIHLDSMLKNRLIEGFTETAWTKQTLVFYDETLEQVAFKMEKWFGKPVYFEKDALRKVKYTGTFENEPLEKVLEIIKLSIPGLQYRINDKKVDIY